MLTEERHHEILDLLNRRGAVTVIELTKLLKLQNPPFVEI